MVGSCLRESSVSSLSTLRSSTRVWPSLEHIISYDKVTKYAGDGVITGRCERKPYSVSLLY